jgi:dimethylamine monooxygenase subunit A
VPLAHAMASPQRARQLHDAIASMSPDVLAYRNLTTVREPLLAWLSRRAGP